MEEETSPEIKPHPQDTHSTTVSLRGVNPEGSLLNKSLDNLSLGESSTSGRVASPRRPMYGQKSVNFKEPIPTPKYNPGKLDNHDESEDSSNNSDIHAAKKRQTSQ
ncbi:uncharacterized protein LOC127876380 isoform X2 [Dreissena polymorpha]|uniref:uncharacterized protein LOC127876380 isoform X2 n=1 Tax=Dreissena polymorpha TaxID=45954 RepID=UPI002265349F|nr:uncharacterized protein LOC127876380 isoform X2 [Dreissena polymorpha]